jgi:predicted PurR-regulated permease PerM
MAELQDDFSRPESSAAGNAGAATRSSTPLRSVALVCLLVLAVFYTLFLARALILPLVVAVLLNLLLAPIVHGLARLRIPMAISALLVVATVSSLFVGGAYLLIDPATQWLEKAPATVSRVERKLRQFKEPVERVQRAGEEVEKLTDVDGQRRATVEMGKPSLTGILFENTRAVLVSAMVVLVLLYFLLASGNRFLRRLVRVVPRAHGSRFISIARQLQRDLSRYLGTVTAINLALGALVALAMHLYGLPNPLLWGVLAAALNFVPYLGSIVGMAIIALVSVVTFDGVGQMILPPLTYLALTGAEGYLLTPMILGRRLTLNPLTILLSLLLWSWLWGIPGAVLSVPILVALKIFCDHLEPLRPLGHFLGR